MHHVGVVLMSMLGVLLLLGVILTVWWGGTAYETWGPDPVDGQVPAATYQTGDRRPGNKAAALRYLRGVGIALVGGFWAGALVTGPAMRLIMRLLAATAGDDAQGRITEAEEVVGKIDLGGTIGLYLFAGILPGVLSGLIYVAFRRWLPSGRLGGIAFGVLHLLFVATRVDPLRPDNPDFDLVGPGWLAVATFGLASVLHGMAVVAIANRYSNGFPPRASSRAARMRAVLPLTLPTLLLLPGLVLLIPIAVGLVVAVAISQIEPVARARGSRAVVIAGRITVSIVAVALLPSTLTDVRDVLVRDEAAESQVSETGE